MFVCLSGILRLTQEFFTYMETPLLPMKEFKYLFYICSQHMDIEQWGFFSSLQLLWYGAYVHNDHLRGPVTLTPVAFKQISVSLTQNCVVLIIRFVKIGLVVLEKKVNNRRQCIFTLSPLSPIGKKAWPLS